MFDGISFKQILDYDRNAQIGTNIFDFDNNEIEKHIQRTYSVAKMD